MTPLRILMLEDSPSDADLIQRLITRGKKECVFEVCANRDAFVRSLQNFHPDIILSDNSMPQFDATEALEITRKHSLSLPFILVTGTVSEEFAANVIRMGADDYILKDRLARLPAAIQSSIERRKSEATIKQSEETRRLIMMSALDAIISIDTMGRIMTWNPQAEKLFGWTEPEVQGKKLSDTIIPDRHREQHERGIAHYLRTGEGPVLNRLVELSALNRAGVEFPIELSIVPIRQDDEAFFCSFIRDITNRKNAEQEILMMNERLRSLSTHLQNIREEESTRIAREIHDQLGQQLTVMKMDAYSLRKRIEGVDPVADEKSAALIDMLDETVKMVRKIAADLRPRLLDDMGLGPAIEYHLKEFGERSGINVFVAGMEEELALPDATKTGLFRIVQEALTNVARHAKATMVTISLATQGTNAVLTIQDDGIGFDTANIKSKKTLGLLGMKERIAMIGGQYEIISAPGAGTTVIVTVPLQV